MKAEKKIFFITGATSGIGKIATLEIAKTGAKVYITSRNFEKDKQTLEELKTKSGNKSIEMILCDFASLDSVKACATNFRSKNERIDVLVNNAGVFATKPSTTNDGIEMNFGVNHLATFLLTQLLIPAVKQSTEGRIIITSSHAHSLIKSINFEDIEFKQKYDSNKTYQQSKLANLLYTKSLSEKLKADNITVNTLNPGVVNTGLYVNYSPIQMFLFKTISRVAGMPLQTPEQGAETTIYLALSDEVKNITGAYFEKKNKQAKPSDAANNANEAEKLWKVTEKYLAKYL